MGVRVSGGSFNVLGIGINWERTAGDEQVARAVVGFLEDRRLLFGDRHVEDEAHCVDSALECRAFLTDQIAHGGISEQLEIVLKAMRAAFRRFVEKAGPHGRNFTYGYGPHGAETFGLALGDLRTSVGGQLAVIAWRYDIEVDDELARILPPDDNGDDPSWVVGFSND